MVQRIIEVVLDYAKSVARPITVIAKRVTTNVICPCWSILMWTTC